MKYPFFFLLIVIFQDCGSCDLTPPECQRVYDFEIPFTISPALDSFHIGDTLFIESILGNLLQDKTTGEEINVTNFEFKLITGFYRIDTLGYDRNVNENVGIINYNGEYKIVPLYNGVSSVRIIYETQNTNKYFKAGLIPKKKGIFHIGFTVFSTDLQDVNLSGNECSESIDLSINMNNGSDNNFYLEEYNLNTKPTEEVFKRAGAYNFVVIE